jgi:hypothetical protein
VSRDLDEEQRSRAVIIQTAKQHGALRRAVDIL